VQLAIRLLLPEGSLLLELPEVRAMIEPFDPRGLCYPWRHPDPGVDELQRSVQETLKREDRKKTGRAEIFAKVCELAGDRYEVVLRDRSTIPYLTEPWYC
jgi:hypothetical protein